MTLSGDAEVRRLVEELARHFRALIDGTETHESLQAWARSAWGNTQESPLGPRHPATCVLVNAWNAASRFSRGDQVGQYILRPHDAAMHLRALRQGEARFRGRWVIGLRQPLHVLAERLEVETVRDIVDGLGWHESARFASPGTGRRFVLSRPLESDVPEAELTTDALAEPDTDSRETLRDLFETLVVDVEDVVCFADGYEAAAAALPRWTLWRQDDNGHRTPMATFACRAKAEGALRKFEALPHKQLYWLEGGEVGNGVAASVRLSPAAGSSR